MTYIVSGGASNSTHSLSHVCAYDDLCIAVDMGQQNSDVEMLSDQPGFWGFHETFSNIVNGNWTTH